MKQNYPIVFAGDNKYIKYIAVTITSLIKNTDSSKTFADYASINNEIYDSDICYKIEKPTQEAYAFHLLTDGITKETKINLDKLITELNKDFPCTLEIHTTSSDDFKAFPALRKNYLTYYRLKLSEFIQEEASKVLYLDGDIIVNSDIRALFALDMQDKVIAAVPDSQRERIFQSYHGDAPYIHNKAYFNAGVMLINFHEWKSQNIAERSFDFLKKYAVINHDQDALNSLIDAFIELPRKYNIPMNGIHLNSKKYNTLPFDSMEWVETIQKDENLKIIHYMSRKKPWSSTGYMVNHGHPDFSCIPYFNYWWHYATKTPAFDLEAIKHSPEYIKAIKQEERLIKFIKSNVFCMKLYLFRLNYKAFIKPYQKKLEAPFKKIRNTWRARKLK